MPDRTYQLLYDARSAVAAAAAIDRLTAALLRCDAAADKLRPKIQGLGNNASRGLNNTTKASDQLGVSFTALQVKAMAAGTALQTASTSAQTMGRGLRGAATNGDHAVSSLQRLHVAGMALRAVGAVTEAFAEAMREAREYAEKSAEKVLKLRDGVRELRMTLGGDTTTKQAAAQVVDLMTGSGADEKTATAFDTMWESTVPAARKRGNWGLNDTQTRDVKRQALAYAVASGMDPKTIGEVVPLIATGERITSPDQLLGKLGTMGRLAVEGVGNLTPMMKVYERLRGTMVRPQGGGAFKTSEELMGAISATSVDTGNVPGITTAMNQVWRDLNLADNDKKVETFKKYGFQPGDDYQTRVHKLAPLVENARAEGKGELEALQQAGFTRLGTDPKIIQQIFNAKVLDENLKMARSPGGGAGVRASNAAFKAENPDRFATAANEAADLQRGEDMVDLVTLRKFAEAGLKRRKGINTPSTNVEETIVDLRLPYVGSLSEAMGAEPARLKRLDDVVRSKIIENVPDTRTRFPGMQESAGWVSVSGASRGEQLAAVVRGLKPEEREKVTRALNLYGTTQGDAALMPTRRPNGAAARAVGPGGANGPQAASGVGAADPLVRINTDQLDVLKDVKRLLGGDTTPRAVAMNGPLRADGGDVNPRRQ